MREFYQVKEGYVYDLAKVETRNEDLELEIQQQQAVELARETAEVGRWEATAPAPEDHLDWYKETLARDAVESVNEQSQDGRQHQFQGEDQMLQEMHRENVEPEVSRLAEAMIRNI